MERGAAKLAKLRLAQTDAAPFPAPRTDVTARSTGFKSNGNFKSNFKSNCNGNDNDNGNGNGNGNGNCRCAYVKSNCNCNCNFAKVSQLIGSTPKGHCTLQSPARQSPSRHHATCLPA